MDTKQILMTKWQWYKTVTPNRWTIKARNENYTSGEEGSSALATLLAYGNYEAVGD